MTDIKTLKDIVWLKNRVNHGPRKAKRDRLKKKLKENKINHDKESELDLHGLSHSAALNAVVNHCDSIRKSDSPDSHLPFAIIPGRSTDMIHIVEAGLEIAGFEQSKIPNFNNPGLIVVNRMIPRDEPVILSFEEDIAPQAITYAFNGIPDGPITWAGDNKKIITAGMFRHINKVADGDWEKFSDINGKAISVGDLVQVHPGYCWYGNPKDGFHISSTRYEKQDETWRPALDEAGWEDEVHCTTNNVLYAFIVMDLIEADTDHSKKPECFAGLMGPQGVKLWLPPHSMRIAESKT